MSTAIATTGSTTLAQMDQWQVLWEQATVFLRSGFLPTTIKTPEQALAIMWRGYELGVPPMEALSSISVINGKTMVGSSLMLSLIYRHEGGGAVIVEETTAERCRITFKRREWAERQEYIYTIDDAKQAGLLSGATWQKHTKAMLRARCISAVARMVFPDAISGIYVAGEVEDSAVEVAGDEIQIVHQTRAAATTIREVPPRQLPQRTIDTTTGEVIDTSIPEPAKIAKKVGPIQQAIIDTLERIHRIAPAYVAPPTPKNAEEGRQQAERLKWDLVAIDGFAAEYNRQGARLRALDPSAVIEPIGGTVEAIKAQAEGAAHAVRLLEEAKDAAGEDDIDSGGA